jgi:hypothetical protein
MSRCFECVGLLQAPTNIDPHDDLVEDSLPAPRLHIKAFTCRMCGAHWWRDMSQPMGYWRVEQVAHM